jgi:hypothetical protein
MKLLPILVLLGLAACGKEADPGAQQPPAQPAAMSPARSGKPAMAQAAMIPVPADKAQLERMLTMGYTVHEDHLHSPGVKECPFNMGGSVVQ